MNRQRLYIQTEQCVSLSCHQVLVKMWFYKGLMVTN